MKYIMFKNSMIVLKSNYNKVDIGIVIGFKWFKHIEFKFLFWAIDFAYDRYDYA